MYRAHRRFIGLLSWFSQYPYYFVTEHLSALRSFHDIPKYFVNFHYEQHPYSEPVLANHYAR